MMACRLAYLCVCTGQLAQDASAERIYLAAISLDPEDKELPVRHDPSCPAALGPVPALVHAPRMGTPLESKDSHA
jgi:hypothetical protein